MSNKAKGYILGAIAAAAYGMNPLFALPLYEAGMNPDSVLFFRYMVAIVILGVMIKMRGRTFRITKQEVLPMVLLGLLFALSSITLFKSYQFMDAGIASTLLFVYPLMVALIMAAVYHERLTVQTIVCVLTAMLGIGLLYKAGDGTTLSLTGTLLAIGSALAYAVYIVGVNHKRLKEVPTVKITFYALVFGWMFFAVRLLVTGDLRVLPPDKWYLWGNILALGLLPTAVSLLCTTTAIQYIGSTPTALLGALEPATAVFFGVTVFGETLTFREVIGLLLIIISVSIVVTGGNVPNILMRFRKLFPSLRRKKPS